MRILSTQAMKSMNIHSFAIHKYGYTVRDVIMTSQDQCSICLDDLTDPVKLPCNHSFCHVCLDGWRSKYKGLHGYNSSSLTCPECRAKLPATRQMASELKYLKKSLADMETMLVSDEPFTPDQFFDLIVADDERLRNLEGDDLQKELRKVYEEEMEDTRNSIIYLEKEIGDGSDLLFDKPNFENLPEEIINAGKAGQIDKVLEWLGSPPVPKERLNAKNLEMAETCLLTEVLNRPTLMSILLQFGCDVDPINVLGGTPLFLACMIPDLDKGARLLLQWGADTSIVYEGFDLATLTLQNGNKKLSRLLETELGGRRCEIFGLQGRKDLNGLTGVAEQYVPTKDRYVIFVDYSGEKILVRPQNLKRRDRTPSDPGIHYTYVGLTESGENHIKAQFRP